MRCVLHAACHLPYAPTQGPNVEQLRIIAATRGLATNALRARAWPVLAGLSPPEQHSFELTSYQAWAAATHRDSAVVKVDVDRSLHAFTKHMSDEQRQAKRAALKRILDATVNSHDGER